MNAYSEKLRDPRWQHKRLEIFQRDEFTCQFCGESKKELQVHHLRYIRSAEPWEYKNDDLITACKQCHENITTVKKLIMDRLDTNWNAAAFIQLCWVIDAGKAEQAHKMLLALTVSKK